MLVLATLGLAAPPTPAWPTDRPFAYEFGLARVWFDAPVLGGEFISHAGPKKTWRWTCTAKPATRAGRQQMTCVEPGLGEIWLLWGPGRRLLEIDVSEDNPTKEQAADRQRVTQLAGTLETWPPALNPGVTWPYEGRGDAWIVASVQGATTFHVQHTVLNVDVESATFRSEGASAMLLAAGGNTESRLQVTIDGETTVSHTSGLLVSRAIRAFPSQQSVGGWGTGGHEITVFLVDAPAP